MARPSDFYVQPGGDIGTGMSQLGDAIQRGMAIKGARDAKQRTAEKVAMIRQGSMDAYQSKDPEKMRLFGIANPEFGQAMFKMAGVETDEQKEKHRVELFGRLNGDDPEAEHEAAAMYSKEYADYKKAMTKPKAAKRSEAMEGYYLAKDQGFEGTYLEFKKELASLSRGYKRPGHG